MSADGSVVFVDTSVYFYAHDDRLPEKQAVCREWLRVLGLHRQGTANFQFANEFADMVLRKLRHIGPEVVSGGRYSAVGASAVSISTIAAARRIHQRFGYSWWDCLLLASALELGCSHFLSEDLQDGQVIEGLTIVDPFAHSPKQILASR